MISGRFLLVAFFASSAAIAAADDVDLVALPTAIPVDVEMTLDVPVFGSSTASDSTSALVAGSNFIIEPDGSSAIFKNHLIVAQNAQINLEFYCGIFGCLETIDVTISSLRIQLAGTYNVPVSPSGAWAIPNALYDLDITYEYVGNLVGSGSSQTFASDVADLSGTLTADGSSSLLISNLDLEEVQVAVTPDSLPTGVNSIEIKVDADLSSLVYEGSLGIFGDLDGDGLVCGSDLTILLAQWGSSGSADLDDDGIVSGPDLTTLLANWQC